MMSDRKVKKNPPAQKTLTPKKSRVSEKNLSIVKSKSRAKDALLGPNSARDQNGDIIKKVRKNRVRKNKKNLMIQNEEDDFNMNGNMKNNIKSARVPVQQLSSEGDEEIPKEMSIVGVSGRFVCHK